jgi:hypothetical protein
MQSGFATIIVTETCVRIVYYKFAKCLDTLECGIYFHVDDT